MSELAISPATCLLDIFVAGTPAPAGSKTAFAFRRGDGSLGAAVTDASKRSKPWKQTIAAVMSEHYDGVPQACALRVALAFHMPRPQAHYGTKKGERYIKASAPLWHKSTPDVDKFERAVFDAGTGIIWADDAAIAQVYAEKCYSEKPGVHISVWRCE